MPNTLITCKPCPAIIFQASFARRIFTSLLSLPILLLLSGCQSQNAAKGDLATHQLDAARNADVPLPSITPFDATPEARAAYLEAYRDGYRSGLVSFNVLFHQPEKTDTIRMPGWQAGASAGFSKHLADVMNKSTP